MQAGGFALSNHVSVQHRNARFVISLLLSDLQSLLPHVTSQCVATSSASKLHMFPCVRLGSRNWHQDAGYHQGHKLLAIVEKLFCEMERAVVEEFVLF